MRDLALIGTLLTTFIGCAVVGALNLNGFQKSKEADRDFARRLAKSNI